MSRKTIPLNKIRQAVESLTGEDKRKARRLLVSRKRITQDEASTKHKTMVAFRRAGLGFRMIEALIGLPDRHGMSVWEIIKKNGHNGNGNGNGHNGKKAPQLAKAKAKAKAKKLYLVKARKTPVAPIVTPVVPEDVRKKANEAIIKTISEAFLKTISEVANEVEPVVASPSPATPAKQPEEELVAAGEGNDKANA